MPEISSEKITMVGLGDTLAIITAATGLDEIAAIYTRLTGLDCGCASRKEALNKLFPYGVRETQIDKGAEP